MTKNMIKLIAALVVTLVAAGAIAQGYGQKNLTPEQRLEKMEDKLDKRMAKLTKKLELTEGQQVDVRRILADAQTQRLALREQYKGDRKAAKPQMKAIREQTKKDLAKVLTDEQEQKLAKIKKNKRGKKGKRGKLKRLAKHLDLTDAQKAQVKAIMQSKRTDLKALRELNLSDEERKAKAKEIRTGAKAEIEAILTAEQKAKFQQLREKRKAKRGKK